MRKIKLTIEYDGTNYCGWQYQTNGISIQEIIEKSVRTMTDEESNVTGASRTDAGVHALGQVAHFSTESNIPCNGFISGINSMLPPDIRIVSAEEVGKDFHARKDAKEKLYRYIIDTSKLPSALYHRRSWHVPYDLNLKAMRKAASYFVGTHDFKAFQASGSAVNHAVRTITELNIKKEKIPNNRNGTTIEVRGDGFIRHMVRNIAGTLVEVGRSAIEPEEVNGIIEGRKRSEAGICAPAQGLYLVRVLY